MQKSESASSLGPGGLDLTDAFFCPIASTAPPSPTKSHTKISVISVGNVGMAIAQTILTQDLTDELALLDANPNKLRGEMLDLQYAATFLLRTRIIVSLNYSVTASSDLCIVTAGAHQIPGETRLDLLHRNVVLFRTIIPPLACHSPDTILMISFVAWKLFGFLSNRVIGSGTNLDSSRFRFLIADHLNVNAQDVQAYTIREHGYTSVALWSSICVGGVPVLSFLERQQILYEKHNLKDIHKQIRGHLPQGLHLLGHRILFCSLLCDQRKIHPVSVLAQGFFRIDCPDVFLSLPAQLCNARKIFKYFYE